MQAFIHTKSERADGSFDSYKTVEVPVKTTEHTPRKGQTSSGYGSALPTQYMVYYNERWQRVKAICYSNAGTLYIGKQYTCRLTVDIRHAEGPHIG